MKQLTILALSLFLSCSVLGCATQDEATDSHSELNDGQATEQSVLNEEEQNAEDDNGM